MDIAARTSAPKLSPSHGRGSQRTPSNRLARAKRVQPALTIREILVPTDFSEQSNFALKYARSVATRFHARITLCYVLKPLNLPDGGFYPYPVVPGQAARVAEKMITRAWEREKSHQTPRWRPLVREGVPHQEIIRAAIELKADLIILATRGRHGIAHAIFGSTAENVIRLAPCPVLVLRLQPQAVDQQHKKDLVPVCRSAPLARALHRRQNPSATKLGS